MIVPPRVVRVQVGEPSRALSRRPAVFHGPPRAPLISRRFLLTASSPRITSRFCLWSASLPSIVRSVVGRQRQREMEIEEKQRSRQSAFGQKPAEPSTTAWRSSRRAQPTNDTSNDTWKRRAPQAEPAGDSWRRGGQQEPSAD